MVLLHQHHDETMVLAFCLQWLIASSSIAAFQFPRIKFVGISPEKVDNIPKRRIEEGYANDLRISLETHCGITQTAPTDHRERTSSFLRWEPNLQESYEVANVIFQEIALIACNKCHSDSNDENATSQCAVSKIISFPSMTRPDDLQAIAKVLQSEKSKMILGLEDASAELYPSSPSPYLQLSFTAPISQQRENFARAETRHVTLESAISATTNWVNNFLGKYNLCPYTSSVSKAAVGLSSVKVPMGKVHIVTGCTNQLNVLSGQSFNYNALRAVELASSFWSETVTLLQSPESEWATSLLVMPEYDNDFESFVDICDNIIQPMIEATSSTDFIGRAWFHPKYNADTVGHNSVIAGHAVPHKMVQQFIQTINGPESIKQNGMTYNDLENANNRVRMTPHATINILRRSQLNAAAQYEKGLGEKRPKPNSIYVRNTLKLIEVFRGIPSNSS
jgi:hypothetical protein